MPPHPHPPLRVTKCKPPLVSQSSGAPQQPALPPSALTGPATADGVSSRRGAGTGGLGLAIEGPSEAKMSCKDNKDGSCTVEYIPFTPGDYDVNITFGGRPIPGVQGGRVGFPEGSRVPSVWEGTWKEVDVQIHPQEPRQQAGRGAETVARRQGAGCC